VFRDAAKRAGWNISPKSTWQKLRIYFPLNISLLQGQPEI
jgi:hypothetical protein